jgi:hypothetical protein
MGQTRRLGTLIVACGLALPACGSGHGPSPSNRPFAAYRKCLEQHGVAPRHSEGGPGSPFGTPGAGSSTATSGAGSSTATSAPGTSTATSGPADVAAFAAARQACGKLRPAGGLRGGGIASKARKAFRHCMASHGVTLPGPAARTSGTGPAAGSAEPPPRGGMLAGLDRHDPAVAQALAACRSLLGTPAASTSTRG